MIDPIGPLPAFAIRLASLEPVPPLHLPLAPLAVDPTARARFEAALRGPAEPTASAVNANAPSASATPGARILDNLERLRDHAREITGRLDALAFQPEIAPRDLLLLQMRIGQVTMGMQLAGQVASKLEQHLNTLLKSS